MLVFNHIAALSFIFIVPFSVKMIAPKIKTPVFFAKNQDTEAVGLVS
jgi:hypothetical protein